MRVPITSMIPMTQPKINIKARHKARCLLVQALYQYQFNYTSKAELRAQCLEDEIAKKMEVAYFTDVFDGIMEHLPLIDQQLAPALDRPLAELTPVELAVLRMAVYELMYRLDIPYPVVINEALELTKLFGTQEGYKYVNGVLDKLTRTMRPEFGNHQT